MEAVVIKLTHIFPSPVRRGGNTTLRCTLIGNSYKKIRGAVLNNAYVIQQTAIQLAEINQTTLIQWCNKRSRKQEEDVLKQGITLPSPVASTNTTLPQPSVNQEKHTFHLPVNTAGQAFYLQYQFLLAPKVTGREKRRRQKHIPGMHRESPLPATTNREVRVGFFAPKNILSSVLTLSNQIACSSKLDFHIWKIDCALNVQVATTVSSPRATYVEKFEQGLEAVQMKQKEREKTASAKTAAAVTQLLNKNAPPSLVDHQWISKALVKWSATGKPEIAYSQINKLWWHPP
ncbi:unnamed protein product [Porites lobata]|uniref:Uncharacterized protein n=1 Tax=Porites lobata TaxID=104759 RepID=A0ABN8RBE8_9CNID|nr:unnamed protein product [Porites lobata]